MRRVPAKLHRGAWEWGRCSAGVPRSLRWGAGRAAPRRRWAWNTAHCAVFLPPATVRSPSTPTPTQRSPQRRSGDRRRVRLAPLRCGAVRTALLARFPGVCRPPQCRPPQCDPSHAVPAPPLRKLPSERRPLLFLPPVRSRVRGFSVRLGAVRHAALRRRPLQGAALRNDSGGRRKVTSARFEPAAVHSRLRCSPN